MNMFLAIVFIVVCVLLVIVVLLQKGRGGGMSGILGGGGQSAFGTRTGDVFTWITIILVGIFLLLAIGATKLFQGGEKTQIPALKFYPPAKDPIDKPKRVTILCGTSKAEIFYTIDGSEPTRKSHKYGTPIRITPGTTLKARAYHHRWKDSDIITGVYSRTPTATAPATMPASGPANATPN